MTSIEVLVSARKAPDQSVHYAPNLRESQRLSYRHIAFSSDDQNSNIVRLPAAIGELDTSTKKVSDEKLFGIGMTVEFRVSGGRK